MITEVVRKNRKSWFLGRYRRILSVMLAFVSFPALASYRGPEADKLVREAKETMESADPVMGDWQGGWTLDDGTDSEPLVARVVALGKGQYRANFHREFNSDWPPVVALDGRLEDAVAQFKGRAESEDIVLDLRSIIKGEKFTGKFKGREADGQDISGSFAMEKVIRLSPTLGAKPPAGAIVLFDGKNFDQWEHIKKKPGVDSVQWKLLEGGVMEVKPRTSSIITKNKFADVKLHLEFRTPFVPDARGQKRGNSGVYLQGRYEVQILDSYGLEGKDNECGGIYKVGSPLVNMCAPPTQWQTYDITFRAVRFNENAEKIRDALLTVVHNGVKIHDNLTVPNPTTAAPDDTETGPGGIYLQDHGNAVQYRNIWLVELPKM